MTKKVYTIDVDNKNLKVSAKSSTKAVKVEEKKEVENFGIVEINNASACKKVKNNTDKGYQKTVVSGAKKSVKAKTSKVDDYFDFSFKKPEAKVEVKAEAKVETKVAEVKAVEVKAEPKVEKTVVDSVKFDSEACQVIRVARMGSLFDCEKRMINA